jgi:ABC-2 type transport system permease protein
MKNIVLICNKEFKGYFVSPIGYAVLALFALIFGFIFARSTSEMVEYGFRAQMMGQQQPMNVGDFVIRPLLGFAGTIALFVIPLITMRLVAEEKRNGTIELLLTSPIREIDIILGKWLGALLLYACMVGMSVLNIGMLFLWGKPDLKPTLIAYLGLLLQGGCLLAIGIFISTTTKNQIIAAGGTFFLCLLLWLLNYILEFTPGTFWQFLNYLSLTTHMESFSKGVLDSKDIIFYLSMIFFFLFLTQRSMESLRWRA